MRKLATLRNGELCLIHNDSPKSIYPMTDWKQIANHARLGITGGPKAKVRRKKKKTGPRKPKSAPRKNDGFYASWEWAELRYKALKLNDGKCELCGASKASGAQLHVDHIKPRSKHPKLELVLSNLQVLCRTCNRGKSNKDETDWRTPTSAANDEWAAIRERLGEA